MEIDYADIILLLGNFGGCFNVQQLSDNARHIFNPPKSYDGQWKGQDGGTERDDLTGPFLSITFGNRPCDPFGWIFGSSVEDECDY